MELDCLSKASQAQYLEFIKGVQFVNFNNRPYFRGKFSSSEFSINPPQ